MFVTKLTPGARRGTSVFVRLIAGTSAAFLLAIGAPRVANGQAPLTVGATAPATLFGVGDISHCSGRESSDATGLLMRHLLATTPNSRGITFGDNSNDDGSEASYRCLDETSWGGLMAQLFPTPGNHDYDVDPILPYYFLYFVNAGQPGQGYYAYDFGGWRVYALNSELMKAGETTRQAREAQMAWLEADLREHAKTKCAMAYFHRPPFSSGRFASPAWVMPIFRKLYKHGVDLIATGHEHFFAALPPLGPDGVVNMAHGIPTLIAGTGGAVFFDKPRNLRYGHGEVVIARTLGVLQVTLKTKAYDWAFVPVDPGGERAAGAGACHDNPARYIE
jgi:hypothetical protein